MGVRQPPTRRPVNAPPGGTVKPGEWGALKIHEPCVGASSRPVSESAPFRHAGPRQAVSFARYTGQEDQDERAEAHPLCGAAADVANGDHAGQAGLQQVGISAQRLPKGPLTSRSIQGLAR